MSQHSDSHGHGHGHHEEHNHGSLKSYTIGFIISIVLTVIPMLVVFNGLMSRTGTLLVILVTAILQLLVQLFFFMHINEGEKPRYNVMALVLGFVIVITIVAGSVWIMSFNSVVQ
ncbi:MULTISPECIES: cytochrome o ubiquinol oxidase subunit IV [unclassified Paenibacillus]|uniref:cytochrome o ubiquinol oxidase subunit IV n=1 Tax=unclassified Paenibacillus TaxID=185978 RepID=UPI0009567D74|nr:MULTISPECIES: cytochrome o ubiquinol oxidase subunit IV [unclassified Paenibacillus]ASS65261.1 cytochrome o ubiquinol oxidase subunit IV [Paenibacillus sp. RUD330]SIQ42301.1 cytochrome o ubiquinol oxidase operon protein cyoD [Paenibacillus sp. RU4X]SIQ64506.1 cytochrome o ubiquinol oxidase operon protein cyoD [Paenibacillus sp. RU4T]